MRFEQIKPREATGWSLAHSVSTPSGRMAKNAVLTPELVERLVDADITSVLAFKLEVDDICENEAAEIVARHIADDNIKVGKPARGRCNLYAKTAGLFIVDSLLNDLNQIEPAIGVATLANLASIRTNQLVATIKVFPYGIEKSKITALCQITPTLAVKAFQQFSVTIISSGHIWNTKTTEITAERIERVSGTLTNTKTCDHTVDDVAETLRQQARSNADLILLSGISAISDARDILPEGLRAAGGRLIHLGMPVDPGNLLMLGELGGKTVVGMPGCSKSPKLNGFDWVLEHFAAGLPLTAEVIQGMGIGGLLKEITERPVLRAPIHEMAAAVTAAIVLAAGKSSRSGADHKLLATLDKKTVIEQAVSTLREAGLDKIIVVTGHRAADVTAALDGQSVQIIRNAAYETGMASSLAAGMAALPSEAEQCFICLGDMPFVAANSLQALIEAANKVSEAEIFTPLYKGKRGNPVLWRKSQFDKLRHITGDKGGRSIIRNQESLVCDVPVPDPGVLIDLDTPEALAQFGITATD